MFVKKKLPEKPLSLEIYLKYLPHPIFGSHKLGNKRVDQLKVTPPDPKKNGARKEEEEVRMWHDGV